MQKILQEQRPAAGKRECFLDLLRILACFLVIVNHTAGDVFLSGGPGGKTWFIAVAWFFFSKPAVLLFYMISGYLLLGRQDSWKTTWRRVRRILIVLIGSAAVYAVYYGLTKTPANTVKEMIWEFLQVYKIIPSRALWYLYTYLGLLLMLPFLQKMAAGMEKRDYYIFFGLTAVLVGVAPMVFHINENLFLCEFFVPPVISNTVAMLFAGNYFARFGVKKTKLGFCLAFALAVGAVVFSTGATWVEFGRMGGENYLFFDNREFLPNMIATVSLFYMATFVKFSTGAGRIVTYVGSCTFGMYLLGDLVQDCLKPLRPVLEGMGHVLIGLVLLEILIFVICFAITVVLRKIPWVRNVI